VESGFSKIVFVNSIDNKADMFTKNVSSELYDREKEHLSQEGKI
jgi:hypothetical protein